MRKVINGSAIKRMFAGKKFWLSEKKMRSNYYLQSNYASEEGEEFDSAASVKRVIACAASALLLIVCQEAFFNNLRIFGVKPNMALVILFIVSTLSAPRFAMLYGLGVGLFVDVIYGKYFGFYALLFMYTGITLSVIFVSKLKGRILIMLAAAPPAFLLYEIIESFFARLLMIYSSERTVLYNDYAAHFTARILPVVLYDTIVLLVLLFPVTFIWTRLGKTKGAFYRLF